MNIIDRTRYGTVIAEANSLLRSIPPGSALVVPFSGGMDSATLIDYAIREGCLVRAISVNYGQRHSVELEYAKKFTKMYGVEHKIVNLDLQGILAGSSLTSADVAVPEGHYADDSMKATVVPNRNMILLALAIGYAVSTDSLGVAYGAHAGDHAIYPDCREEFADAMAHAAHLCDYKPREMFRPFINLGKHHIAALGSVGSLPYELTWSCYKGGQLGEHCGLCATCIERREAFHLAGLEDPSTYQVSQQTSFEVGKISQEA